MGLFASLNMGVTGLTASQMALDITGQNITNANTEGYSRKRLSQASLARTDTAYGQVGMGVDVSHIERIREEFLDKQIQTQTSRQNYYSQMDHSLERVENIFTEPTDNALNKYMDDFWNAWQDLANNPADLSSREAVATSSQVMTDQFHAVWNELDAFQDSIDEDISAQVEGVNNLIREVKKLNDDIASVEMDDASRANDSRDKRTQLLKELSKLIPVSYVEEPDGRAIVTTKGNMLVGAQDYNELELYRRTQKLDDGTIEAKVFVRYAGTKKEYKPDDGSLAALFETRDQVLPGLKDKLDTLADTMISTINTVHYKGYDLDGETGANFFDPSGTGAQGISLSAAILDSGKNIAAAQGGSVQSQGGAPLPFTVQANQTINLRDPLQGGDPRFQNLMQGSLKIMAGTVQLQEGAAKDYVVDPQNGLITFVNSAGYPAGTPLTAEFLYNDATFGGVGDGRNALAIAKLKDAASMVPNSMGEFTQTSGEFYNAVVGNLGIARNEATSYTETHNYMLEQLNQQQDAVAGVSLDEEMANMIKFEHTYQASAKYISTVNDMMDVLVNLV